MKKSNIKNFYIINKINNLSFGIINKLTVGFSIEIIQNIKFIKYILYPLNKNKQQKLFIDNG